MSVITAIISFIYLCINISCIKNKDILMNLLKNCLLIVLMTAFFWMPLLETKFSTDYSVYQKDTMSTIESFNNNKLDFSSLYDSKENSTYIYKLCMPIIFMFLISIFSFKKVLQKHYKKEYFFFFFLGILTTFMSTKYFLWGPVENQIKIIQFPWRLLVFSNFSIAIVCSINVSLIVKKFSMLDVLFFTFITLICIYPLKNYIPINENIEELTLEKIGIVAKDTNTSMVGMGKGEYLPQKSNLNRLYIISRSNTLEFLNGSGTFYDLEKFSSNLSCKINISEDNTIIELPYIYYPGYIVTINNQSVSTFENENRFFINFT